MKEITRIATFRDLSAQGRQRLESGALTYRFPPGKTIIEKGQDVSGAYFVLEGSLRVFTLLPGGKEATLYPIRPGETCVLAMNSLFNDLLYPAWVQTEEQPTTVAVVPGRLYRALFETEPVIQDLTVRTLSTLVFRLMAELDQVHACTVEQRLGNFLVVRASGKGEVRLTQQEIAGHIGTTREVVARLTSRMAARGLIATGRGKITLLQPTALVSPAGTEDCG
ncbi:Crp/Fnr family transcriptional regulator [Paramagnetospirillum magneticum]|uniref:cAMP-binding protein-catabolite gene activator and regulatory subunit of cAMP-dependent protein kinase n=1 Tax=Paramagnetospirillum magneticum (strain ATCC 700264 / AMB-1) TaxID=342108 RepID=Q2W800_PARM1|nr:Crp/Fnr family transcriptional regulator [Paramagnetospirillum magneticum]BAE50025.1 cAMP-binding protein - catabolite gene activator and regulatory subunit of cAMP-dependent protein kinase [Paramagnetospirillum magneticum AMB-1]